MATDINKISAVLGVHGLRLNVRLGCSAGERALIQPVDIDVLIKFDQPPKGLVSDELDETICYAQLSENLKETIETREFQLIEHMAHEAFQSLKKMISNSNQLAIRVHKLKPPVANLNGGTSFVFGDWAPHSWC
jgi:dihydroneopterin aldolase